MWSQREVLEFSDLISALENYRDACLSRVDVLIPTGLRTPDELASLRAAVRSNSDLFEFMAREAPLSFGCSADSFSRATTRSPTDFDSTDLQQLTAALRAAARDWTSLGATERRETYGAILSVLNEFLDPGQTVLIPGSGLGRLAVEVASDGFVAHANESSFIMLVAAWAALMRPLPFRIFPFLHQLSGLDTFADSLLAADFPDRNDHDPAALLADGRLRLLAGQFAGLAEAADDTYDAVVTCYFIDVVGDMAAAIGIIHRLLRPGGYWINMGPMMLHHGDDAFFTTQTLEDVSRIAAGVGFEIIREERIETTYIANPAAHIRTMYKCKLSVARR
jgi:carnosine N-methyltransferase